MAWTPSTAALAVAAGAVAFVIVVTVLAVGLARAAGE